MQPASHDLLSGGYMIHHSRPTEIRVETTRPISGQLGDANTILYDMNAYAEENKRMPLDVEMEFTIGAGI